jgi:hypothetical protein
MEKWEAKLKKIEERASHYERKPLSSVYRPRLSKTEDPPSIWKLFHRQNQAFNFVKSCKEVITSSFFFFLRATIAQDFFLKKGYLPFSQFTLPREYNGNLSITWFRKNIPLNH